MPRFFFDFHGSKDAAIDDEGCEFDNLELAYLDAYRSMVRIGAELLLEQRDPSTQWIDIRGDGGMVLMTVAFDEVFRRRSRMSPTSGGNRLQPQLERSRRLRQEVREACASARASLANARQTLSRADALKLVTGPLGS